MTCTLERARGGGGGGRRPGRRRAHWPARGCGPAPSSRLALIELGLSFDFEWGERAVLRAGKNYTDPIPSVIGIIRYTPPLIQLCGCEPSRAPSAPPRGSALRRCGSVRFRSDGAVSGGAADAGRVGLVAAAWSTGTWAARAAASRAAACRAASCRGASWRRAGRCRRPPTATRACATSRRRRARARRTTPCGTTTSSRRP